jgi:hypothetical protein
MGGEVWLFMAKGETKKLRAHLINKGFQWQPNEFNIKAPIKDTGCWIAFKGRKVEVGYQVFAECSEWAKAVAIEIRKKFKVLKEGWDSVGYCKDALATRPWNVYLECLNKRKKENKIIIQHYKNSQILFERKAKEIFV